MNSFAPIYRLISVLLVLVAGLLTLASIEQTVMGEHSAMGSTHWGWLVGCAFLFLYASHKFGQAYRLAATKATTS